MNKLLNIPKVVLKNKVTLFGFIRYGIHFINSLFIGVYLWVWGCITLVISYMNHLGFGMADSVKAIISVKEDKEFYVQKVIGTALTMFTSAFCFSDVILSINTFF